MKTTWSRWVLAAAFVAAGVMHLLAPKPFLSIMPRFLPYPELLVALSGLFEIAGGVGVLLPRVRRAAGWGLVLLLIAVFPANVQALLNGLRAEGWTVYSLVLVLRLPLQPVLIYWVVRATGLWSADLSGCGHKQSSGSP